MKRSFIREILEAIDEETISFAGGLPSGKSISNARFKESNFKSNRN